VGPHVLRVVRVELRGALVRTRRFGSPAAGGVGRSQRGVQRRGAGRVEDALLERGDRLFRAAELERERGLRVVVLPVRGVERGGASEGGQRRLFQS